MWSYDQVGLKVKGWKIEGPLYKSGINVGGVLVEGSLNIDLISQRPLYIKSRYQAGVMKPVCKCRTCCYPPCTFIHSSSLTH